MVYLGVTERDSKRHLCSVLDMRWGCFGLPSVNELLVMLFSQVDFELLPYNTKFRGRDLFPCVDLQITTVMLLLSVARLTLDHGLVGVPWIRYAYLSVELACVDQ
uniref:Uncharacterized protein n=1 Tax=Ananas comosus var. bracteatus TaxID=296719 RepID=A0A6V7PGM4_ANACO|nr:unnamed protein product [Ananas comosus var. bracteatus]